MKAFRVVLIIFFLFFQLGMNRLSTEILERVFNIEPSLRSVDHCGTISSSETWSSANNVHVVTCDTYVAYGAKLTITEGTIIKFKDDTSLNILGALDVLGTDTNPVYLTSFQDDTVGGDTNNDGAKTTPSPGDWERISFEDSSEDSNSLIDHAIIRYGGYYSGYTSSYTYAGIDLFDASPTIINTTFYKNKGYALRMTVGSSPVLLNNTYTKNDINGIGVQNGTISENTNWNITDTVYFIIEEVAIGYATTLTINPGVVVKFNDDAGLVVQGALRALGTGSSPVYFTSRKDDSVKGDTNNDGASSPNPGDWMRIKFMDESDDANSLIDHAIIRYGGYYSGYTSSYTYAGIDLFDASPTIKNSLITQNKGAGIRLNNSQPILGCNKIFGNVNYGIVNTTTSILVNAKNQWWGTKTGPYHPTLNPTGTGNQVSNGVAFKPWAANACVLPGKFAKTSPLNNQVNTSPNPTLKWGTSSNALRYEYCIDKINNSKCDSSWISTKLITSVSLSGLTPARYYWHVRAKNSIGTTYSNGSSTSWWSLVVPPKPGAFMKTSPVNTSTGRPVNPTLKWGASSNAASYEYCLDADTNTTCNSGWKPVGNNLQITVSGLLKGTTYSWQVRSKNAFGITFANKGIWWTFTTIK